MQWFNVDHFASQDDDFPLSAKKVFLTDTVALVVIMGVIAVVGTQFCWLSLGFVSLMFINGAWHTAHTITRGRYSPGTLTSILFNIPLGAYIIYFYLSGGYASLLDVAIAYAIGLIGNAAFFLTVRSDIQSYPERLTKAL